MPKELHDRLSRDANRKGLRGERRKAYIYGVLAKVERGQEGKAEEKAMTDIKDEPQDEAKAFLSAWARSMSEHYAYFVNEGFPSHEALALAKEGAENVELERPTALPRMEETAAEERERERLNDLVEQPGEGRVPGGHQARGRGR